MLCMLPAIQLNSQLYLATGEIKNERTNGMLAAKFMRRKAVVA